MPKVIFYHIEKVKFISVFDTKYSFLLGERVTQPWFQPRSHPFAKQDYACKCLATGMQVWYFGKY